MTSRQSTGDVERAVEEITGVKVSLNSNDDQILVSGRVDSAEQRDAVIDVVTSLLPDARVDDALIIDVMGVDVTAVMTDDDRLMAQLPPEPESDDESVETVFAPTDPVVTVDESGEVQILGGFSETSLDEIEVDASSTGPQPGDLALEDAIRRELREDAATTDLRIGVRVAGGVVYLTGRVPGPEDADAAESVAASVPGVREVVEELEVGS